MPMAATCLMGLLLLLIVLGIPIGTALGVAGVATLAVFGLGVQMTGANFVSSMASFPLLAIPFFVLAGVILEKARLAARIADLFELVAGRATGGLAIVAVFTCAFWGAISGSGPATTAAVGLILLEPMIRHGYNRNFAAAVIANTSDLSIIIPPSIAFIIYGHLTGTSVSALFAAGALPGMAMSIGIAAVAWWISRRRGWRGHTARAPLPVIGRAFVRAFWALLAPVIILGGIYSGIFTATEAAVVAVFYSLLVATVVYRSIAVRDLVPMLVDATATSAVIMFIVVFAGIFSWAASTTGVIDKMAAWLIHVAPGPLTIILLINLLLLLLGMFLDAISICYLVMPILLPVLQQFGIDRVWYGVIFVTALAIGQTTPPVGVNLATAANLIKGSMDGIVREIWPFIAVNVAVLGIISVLPQFSLWLPRLAGLL